MIVTDVRTFRANLKQFLGEIKSGKVVDVSGLKLCVYTGDNDIVPSVYTTTGRINDALVEKYASASEEVSVDEMKAVKFQELKKQMDARATPNTSHRDDVYTFTSKQVYPTSIIIPPHYTETISSRYCEKCKQPSECRKMYEEGVEHVICEECAKKAKLNWNKLEKL